jgi:hypothetical protein
MFFWDDKPAKIKKTILFIIPSSLNLSVVIFIPGEKLWVCISILE